MRRPRCWYLAKCPLEPFRGLFCIFDTCKENCTNRHLDGHPWQTLTFAPSRVYGINKGLLEILHRAAGVVQTISGYCAVSKPMMVFIMSGVVERGVEIQ